MHWTYSLSYMRNATFIIFLQQILSNKLLLAITDGKNTNFSSEFKLELITTFHLKLLEKCYNFFCKFSTLY